MATNLRAYANGAGSGKYTDFVPFDSKEIYKMIGVHGLTPKPQFDFWFCLEDREPLFGSAGVSVGPTIGRTPMRAAGGMIPVTTAATATTWPGTAAVT